MRKALPILFILLAFSAAGAVEVTPFVGYRWGGELDAGDNTLFDMDVDIDESDSLGLSVEIPVVSGLAIEILEVIEDRLNEQLVNPLKGLAAAQLNNGRPDLATNTLDRATHITHVNEGPHNYDQVEILESLAEANVRLGDIEAARDLLDRIHILNVRHFEDDALGLLPSMMRRTESRHSCTTRAIARRTWP